MAVKATAEVTIMDETDASSLVMWYYSTTSATKPSKPTTTSASATPSGWSKTEPTISSDSDLTKYVYTSLQLVWGDGSCSWGDVSTSAAFEAAKRAYNQGKAASDKVDSMEIGGRNLLRGTKDYSTKSSTNQVGISISTDYFSGTKVLVGTWASGNMDIGRFANAFSVELQPNSDYTLSFWAKATAAINVVSYLFTPSTVVSGTNSSGNTTTASDGAITTTLSTEWERYWVTWHMSTAASQATQVLVARVGSSASGKTVYVAGVKFEQGNKPTDWTKAPEDTEAEIAEAAKVATNYIEQDSTGIKIRMTGNTSTYQHQSATGTKFYVDGAKRSEVGGDGLKVYIGSANSEVSVAEFGQTARIGQAAASHVLIEPNAFAMKNADDRLVEVRSSASLTSVYIGGSTAADGTSATDSYVTTLLAFLKSGCTVTTSGGVQNIYDSSGTDTGLTVSTASGATNGAVLDTSGNVISSASYASIQYDGATFYLNEILYPLSELPGTPTHVEAGGVAFDLKESRLYAKADRFDASVNDSNVGAYATDNSIGFTAGTDGEYRAWADNDGLASLYLSDVSWYDRWSTDSNDHIQGHIKNGSSDSTDTYMEMCSAEGSTKAEIGFIQVSPPDGTSSVVEIGNTNGIHGVYSTYGQSSVGFGVGSGGVNHGVYSITQNKWLVHGDANSVYLGGKCITQGSVGQTNSVAANGYKDITTNFGHTYSAAPIVIPVIYSTSTSTAFDCDLYIKSVSTSSFTVRIFNRESTARSPGFHWIAIG